MNYHLCTLHLREYECCFSHLAQYQRFLVLRVKNTVYTAKAAIVFRYGDFGEICELTEPDCAHMEPEKINVRQAGRDMNSISFIIANPSPKVNILTEQRLFL